MLIPPPAPSFTLSPSLGDLSPADLAAVQRCVASLAGQMGGVVVTGVRVRGRHRIVEVETLMGTVIVQEALEPSEEAPAPGRHA